MENENKIFSCPKCKKKFTIPVNKHISLHCPKCNAKLEYTNGVLTKVNDKPHRTFGRKARELLQKILIGAIITWCLNFILLRTGWNEWKNVSEDITVITEKIKDRVFTLSPTSILFNYSYLKKQIAEKKGSWGSVSSPYPQPTIVENINSFFRNYWYTPNGKVYWFGRILLIISCLISIVFSVEAFENSTHSLKGWVLLLNFIYYAGKVLFIIWLLATFLFLAMKALLFIGGGIVALFTFLAAGGGFLKLVVDEIKQEMTDQPKNKIIQYVLALFPKRK